MDVLFAAIQDRVPHTSSRTTRDGKVIRHVVYMARADASADLKLTE